MAGKQQGSFSKRKNQVLSTAEDVSFTSGSPPGGSSIAPPPYSKALSPPPGDIRPASPPPAGEIQPPLHAPAIATKRHRVDNSDGFCICNGCICGGCTCSTSSLGSSSLCMEIPNNKWDLIIGEDRTNINWMQSKSGAKILLRPKDTSGETTTMYISGKPEKVKTAKELVDNVLSEGYYCPPLEMGYPGSPPKKMSGHAYKMPGEPATP